MKQRRLAPLVGIAGCLLVVGLLAVPYALVRTSAGSALATYYGTGAVNPAIAGLFALIAVIVLAAGREERADPALASGVALVLGVFVAVLTALWAVTVPTDVVVGMDAPREMEYHRWLIVAAAAAVPVAGGWWARTLGFL